MYNKISKELFYHYQSQALLNNNFCENEWVWLYKSESFSPIEKVELSNRLWTYIASADVCNDALLTVEPEYQEYERSALYGDNTFKSYKKDGFEPLVTVMNFYATKPSLRQIRIHEDFIHMFHLYESSDNNGNKNYIWFESGDSKIIITISNNEVKIKHQFLVDFLAAKKMNLVCAVHSELNIPPDLCNLIDCEYKLTGPAGVTKNSENTIINFSVSLTGGVEFQSWFIGKKIVPYKNFGEFKSSFDSQYADFIVGYDPNNCEEIKISCADDSHKYSRTYFKKEVLEKYRSDINAAIEPYRISSTYFSLKCDNDNIDFIWTYLKELRCLPYTEQLHWASYNILQNNYTESQFYQKNQECWNHEYSSPDFVFREAFREVNKLWEQKFDWKLFKPTTGVQANVLERIFILSSNSIVCFRNLVEQMNLLLSESIDVSELNKIEFPIPNDKKDCKAIMKLNYFLEYHNQSKTPLVNFLLQLDTLRSEFTDTHRNDSKMNSKNLQKALDYFGINNNGSDYKLGAIQLFEKATEAFIWFKSVVASME